MCRNKLSNRSIVLNALHVYCIVKETVRVTLRSIVSRQLGVLFHVVLLICVETRYKERPQRLLGRRVQYSVHVCHELRYVPVMYIAVMVSERANDMV